MDNKEIWYNLLITKGTMIIKETMIIESTMDN
jgi:hypothetical protein